MKRCESIDLLYILRYSDSNFLSEPLGLSIRHLVHFLNMLACILYVRLIITCILTPPGICASYYNLHHNPARYWLLRLVVSRDRNSKSLVFSQLVKELVKYINNPDDPSNSIFFRFFLSSILLFVCLPLILSLLVKFSVSLVFHFSPFCYLLLTIKAWFWNASVFLLFFSCRLLLWTEFVLHAVAYCTVTVSSHHLCIFLLKYVKSGEPL